MSIRGDGKSYGTVTIALHWASGAAVPALLALGFAAASATDPARIAALLRVHVPLGIAVLALTLARIVWRPFDNRPGDPAGQPRWQALAAHANHALLHAALLLIGVSGIALLVLSGVAPILFAGADRPLPRFDFAPMKAHALGAFALVALICLHVGAALYHDFYRRDHLLGRMGIGAGQRGLTFPTRQSKIPLP